MDLVEFVHVAAILELVSEEWRFPRASSQAMLAGAASAEHAAACCGRHVAGSKEGMTRRRGVRPNQRMVAAFAQLQQTSVVVVARVPEFGASCRGDDRHRSSSKHTHCSC